ncbi:DUF1800 domain-containing protein [Thermaurantiacus sp.]
MQSLTAQNRFGLGARAGDVAGAGSAKGYGAPADGAAALLRQFESYDPRPPAIAALPATAENAQVEAEATSGLSADGMRLSAEERRMAQGKVRPLAALRLAEGIRARTEVALVSDAPFVERLVHFWANHFAVSVGEPRVSLLAANFEFDAIRPHVLGRFEDLLLAAIRHPALLTYLDQISSMGPNSPNALKRNTYRRQMGSPDEFGSNENFAREVLELHTLGVDGGYTQKDVIELAHALSGWGVRGFTYYPQSDAVPPGAFVFNPSWHEPGARTIMGVTYRQTAEAQGLAALRDLARHPSTARHISFKLARHVVADDPPPALVDRMAARFLATGGDLAQLYTELVQAPEAWSPRPAKVRTPWDWTLAALRALGVTSVEELDMGALMTRLGQPVWGPGSPAGWPDVGGAWSGTNMMLARIEAARQFAAQFGAAQDTGALSTALFGAGLSQATARSMRGTDGADALAMLLLSSEFYRR